MTKVSFELGTDASDFLSGFRAASSAVTDLQNETKDLSDASKKVFKSNAEEVQKFSTELTEGAKQTGKMREEVNNIGKTKNVIQQLKAEIKNYTAEAYKAGEGTKAFKENLEKAGALKDQLADLNANVKSLTGNIGENLARAAGNSLSLVARGFEGASSVSILLGNNTKQFEETLLKLQAFNGLANVAGEFASISDKITEIKLGFAPVTELFRNGASSITSSYGTANESLKSFFTNFGGNAKAALRSGLDFFKNFGSNAVSVAKSAAAGFTGFFSNFGTNMKSFAASAKSGISTIGTAIKANPLGIILTAVVAITAAFIVFRDKIKPVADLFAYLGDLWDNAVGFLSDMAEKFGLMAGAAEKKRDAIIKGHKDEMDAIGKQYDYEIQLLEASGLNTQQKEKEKQKALIDRVNASITALKTKQAVEGKLSEEELNDLRTKENERVEIIRNGLVIQTKLEKEASDKAIEDKKKRDEILKQQAEKRKQQEQQYLSELADLAKRAQQAELEGLTGEARLVRQKKINDESIDQLEKHIVRLNQLNGRGNELTLEQQQYFNALRNKNEIEFSSGIIKLKSEEAEILASIQTKENQDQLSALEQKAKIQQNHIESLQAPKGSTKNQEEIFELKKQEQILEIQKKAAQESLNIKIKSINDEANAKIKGFQNELKAIENQNDSVAIAKKAALNQSIKSAKNEAELATEEIVSETDATVAKINDSLGKIGEDVSKKIESEKIDYKKLFQFDSNEISKFLKVKLDIEVSPENVETVKSAIQQVGNSLKELMQAYYDAQNEMLDQELKASQERMDARDKALEDLRSKLQEEEALRDQGLANNSDRIKEQIAQEEAKKQAEVKRQKEIMAEKKKLAKQQLIIDTAMQASQMVLAIAQMFAGGSSFWVGPVPVGYIVAGLASAAMIASFIAGKKQAFDAVNSDSAQLYTGGYTGDGGKYEAVNAVVHKGEYVMNKETTDKNWDLLHGLHTDDKTLMERGIRDLIKGKGIYLASDIPEEINVTKSQLRTAELKAYYRTDNSGMENRMDKIEAHVRELVKQGQQSEQVLPDGSRIIKNGSLTTVIKAKR